MSNPRPVLLHNVQLLRAFAALAVVVEHAAGPGGMKLPHVTGAFGVDVFFVISGFIIAYVSRFDPSQFMMKRIIRIIPFYWTATTAIFLLGIAAPSLLHTSRPDIVNYLRSLFFIPYNTPQGAIPIMGLGWTLNYEMYFYVVFAICLALNRKLATVLCAAAIVAVMGIVKLLGPATPAGAFYGQTIVLEFLYGMGIFHLTTSARFLEGPRLRKGTMAAMAVVAALCAGFLGWQETIWSDPTRFVTAGIPAAILVYLLIVLERKGAMTTKSRAVLLTGEASYIIYLLHPYIVFGILRTFLHSAPAWPEYARWALIPVLLIVVSCVAIVVHLRFERPVMQYLRATLLHKPPPTEFLAR